ncbi:MAG: hypothetical protein KDK40_03270, partial [Chlamydiia bacterium]|nr:hypothetical protein [Chlamydiia bacterium]
KGCLSKACMSSFNNAQTLIQLASADETPQSSFEHFKPGTKNQNHQLLVILPNKGFVQVTDLGDGRAALTLCHKITSSEDSLEKLILPIQNVYSSFKVEKLSIQFIPWNFGWETSFNTAMGSWYTEIIGNSERFSNLTVCRIPISLRLLSLIPSVIGKNLIELQLQSGGSHLELNFASPDLSEINLELSDLNINKKIYQEINGYQLIFEQINVKYLAAISKGLMCLNSHNCPKLKSLEIGFNNVIDRVVFTGMAAKIVLEQTAKLSKLSLHKCYYLNPSSFDDLRHHRTLTDLNLSVTECNDSTLRTLAEHCKDLKKLDLYHTPTTDDGLLAIIQSCTELEFLNIARMNKTPTVFSDRSINLLYLLPNLRVFLAHHNAISDVGVQNGIRHCAQLCEVNLSYNCLTDVGKKILLESCGKLRHLDVTRNSESDQSLKRKTPS